MTGERRQRGPRIGSLGWVVLVALIGVTARSKLRLPAVGDGWLVLVLCSITAVGWLTSRALAARRWPVFPDNATLRAVGLGANYDRHVLHARNVVAHYFWIPGERLNPAATLGVVANSAPWFGAQSVGFNDLLADLRESYGCGPEVVDGISDDTTVAEVVRAIAQALASVRGT
jgi:hypothetical protein